MENVISLDEEKMRADEEWAKLFDHRIQKEFLRHCVYSISLNDPAHNLNHVMDVCKLAKRICAEINLGERDTLLVYVACLLHDIGCRYERSQHHLIGYGLTYEIIDRIWSDEFDDDEVMTIATAVLEHRSSNKQKPSSLISSIVSVADSGAPDFAKYVRRAVQFRLKRNTDVVVIVEDVYEHLLEKFGAEGYHWKSYPVIGMDFFKKEWDDFSEKLCDEKSALELIRATYIALGGGSVT
ncbi:phosphohydrolase [Erwinia phage AH04]|uniref:Phosphohydrolase n=1 Tax=Erwinia phage AH04 TaxID=2869569 RepID=A0AAE7X1V4_9CAUD|nr:phosphohydrolase [Erwinia phage AH04]QZA70764.1 phosphohydrolase [Erwinia phage AH04]